MSSDSPLSGIRVLDFSHVLAGPFCTRLLADLGADVVRLETSLRPDRLGAGTWRKGREEAGDRPAVYLNTNRSKRAIDINLKTPEGLQTALDLAGKADVVVENFSAGVMDRLGLGYAQLSAANPMIIFARMAGFGQDGPRRAWTSMNMNLQACSSLMMTTGETDEPPIAISNSWNDYVGGLHTAFAIIEALAQREQDGRGRVLDVSQFECSVSSVGGLLIESAVTGKGAERMGNRHRRYFPHDVYRCAGADAWCALCIGTDDEWQRLTCVPGLEALLPYRACGAADRRRHRAAIDSILAEFFGAREAVAAEQLLREAGAPAQAVCEIDRVVERASTPGGVFVTFDEPRAGAMLTTSLPFSFSRSGLAAMRSAPLLGEHTDEVLQEWLGAWPDRRERPNG